MAIVHQSVRPEFAPPPALDFTPGLTLAIQPPTLTLAIVLPPVVEFDLRPFESTFIPGQQPDFLTADGDSLTADGEALWG